MTINLCPTNVRKRGINTLLHYFEAIRQIKHYLKSGGLQYIFGDKLSM